MLLVSAFHWLFCLKFSFKLVTYLRVRPMQKNKSGCFFSEHSAGLGLAARSECRQTHTIGDRKR